MRKPKFQKPENTSDIQWKPIPGYDERYFISTNGDVCRIRKFAAPSLMKTKKRGKHMFIDLRAADGQHKTEAVYHLMERTFLNQKNIKNKVFYLNGNCEDCSLKNLQYNQPRQPKQLNKEVARLDKYGNVTKVFTSATEAASKAKLSKTAICNHCNGMVKGMLAADGFQYKWAANADY